MISFLCRIEKIVGIQRLSVLTTYSFYNFTLSDNCFMNSILKFIVKIVLANCFLLLWMCITVELLRSRSTIGICLISIYF